MVERRAAAPRNPRCSSVYKDHKTDRAPTLKHLVRRWKYLGFSKFARDMDVESESSLNEIPEPILPLFFFDANLHIVFFCKILNCIFSVFTKVYFCD